MNHGVLMLFFDMPTETKEDLRVYSRFKKHLKTEGYVSLQESVYMKQINNIRCADTNIRPIRELTNDRCNVWAIVLTLNSSKAWLPFEEKGHL